MTDVAALPDDDLRELVDLVVDPDLAEPMGAYLFSADEPGALLARHVEQAVFREAFGNTPEMLGEEYGPYESNSIFFCVIDHRRRLPAGTARIVLPEPGRTGSKTLDDIEPFWGLTVDELLQRNDLDMPLREAWDIATLAVAPAYRGAAAAGLVSMALYQSITMSAQRHRVDWVTAILDLPVYRMFQLLLRNPFTDFVGTHPLPYLGSAASLPVWMQISGWEQRLHQADPDLHDTVFNGIGLEPAVRVLDRSPHPRLSAWQDDLFTGLSSPADRTFPPLTDLLQRCRDDQLGPA